MPAKKTAKRKTAKKRGPSAAFMKPMQPSDTLSEVIGSKAMPRTEVTKKPFINDPIPRGADFGEGYGLVTGLSEAQVRCIQRSRDADRLWSRAAYRHLDLLVAPWGD